VGVTNTDAKLLDDSSHHRRSALPLQVLEVNKDKDIAFSLAEYNRVRKPDMDALRYLDTISGRIWGGALSKPDHFDT
jgi:hypothetical protein